jgi:hypothetical protein
MGDTGNLRPLTVLLARWSLFPSIGYVARPSLCSFRSSMLAVATAGARVVYHRRNKTKPIGESDWRAQRVQ